MEMELEKIDTLEEVVLGNILEHVVTREKYLVIEININCDDSYYSNAVIIPVTALKTRKLIFEDACQLKGIVILDETDCSDYAIVGAARTAYTKTVIEL